MPARQYRWQQGWPDEPADAWVASAMARALTEGRLSVSVAAQYVTLAASAPAWAVVEALSRPVVPPASAVRVTAAAPARRSGRVLVVASAAGRPSVTPAVRTTAQRLGVDLDRVTGTGVGGRVRVADVQAAAVAAAPVRPAPTTARAMPTNPVAAAARQRYPQHVAAAQATGLPEPTLFHSGDLPPFTASGVDPSALLQVPWQARPAVAAAATPAEAYELVEAYSGPDGDVSAAMDFAGVQQEYEQRHQAWLVAGATDDELYEAMFPEREQVGFRPAAFRPQNG